MVTTSRGDHDVGPFGELSGERLWLAVGEIDVEFVHHLDDFGMNAIGGSCPGGGGRVAPIGGALNSASLIWDRPALCGQTNRAVLTAGSGGAVVGAASPQESKD